MRQAYSNSQIILRPHFVFLALAWYATVTVALASSTGQRTVLVTGGAGYIGSHTCLELLNVPDKLYRVIVVDNLDNSSEESLKKSPSSYPIFFGPPGFSALRHTRQGRFEER